MFKGHVSVRWSVGTNGEVDRGILFEVKGIIGNYSNKRAVERSKLEISQLLDEALVDRVHACYFSRRKRISESWTTAARRHRSPGLSTEILDCKFSTGCILLTALYEGR